VKPSVTVAETTAPGGARLSLHRRDAVFVMRIGGDELMSTLRTRSELRLAELGCEHLGRAGRANILIGGLGFGFTLRRVLELVHDDVQVRVAELIPEIVAWNRTHLQSVNGALIDQQRVEILIDDVYAVLRHAQPGEYDAVLLDVDNGPVALVDAGNARLYSAAGLRVLWRALRAGGRAVVWSADPDRPFMARLIAAGFRVMAIDSKAYPKARRDRHTLIVADRPG
jgi:spermidine synthase